VELQHRISVFLSLLCADISKRLAGHPWGRLPSRIPTEAGHWFADHETRKPWGDLALCCAIQFTNFGHGSDITQWKEALANWFRNRGIYDDCLIGFPPDAATIARKLTVDVQTTVTNVVHLTPLDGLSLKCAMSFDSFALMEAFLGQRGHGSTKGLGGALSAGDEGRLSDIRNLACRVAVRMIQLLNELVLELENGILPDDFSRERVLAILDPLKPNSPMEAVERAARDRVRSMLEK
jgi:hypothetical protein